ncbi:PPOX class F420-dependent oxidoreductase [Streptomyces sp. NPDC092129]|jgi:PPOX class probable F420-dependent enzyme|uniref:PPOX class F420-dependent oxidoreductase n=1 Tax=Streptomyces sp. NPDC092129 TaxID=3366010 RepID=UPI0038128D21
MASLSAHARSLIDGRNFATVATIQPDGRPQQTVVWVIRDGDDVVFSVVVGRQKYLNLLRDPRIGVLITAADNPYRYVEIRGTATMTPSGGTELVDTLSVKYTGRPFHREAPGTKRVSVRVTAEHVNDFG